MIIRTKLTTVTSIKTKITPTKTMTMIVIIMNEAEDFSTDDLRRKTHRRQQR